MSDQPIPFAPPDGRKTYTNGDYEKISRQQPVAFAALPSFMIEKDLSPVIPPKLWCGWRIDLDELFVAVQHHFPEAVWSDPVTNEPGARGTIYNANFRLFLRDALGIPPRFVRLIDIVRVIRPGSTGPEDNPDTILAIGNTVGGVLPKNFRDEIGERLAQGKEPQWYLDRHRWCWMRPVEKHKNRSRAVRSRNSRSIVSTSA